MKIDEHDIQNPIIKLIPLSLCYFLLVSTIEHCCGYHHVSFWQSHINILITLAATFMYSEGYVN